MDFSRFFIFAMSYNKQIGEFGEKLARSFLIKKGYKIIDNNVKTGYQELDIIASLDGVLAFIEVKTRTSSVYGSADETVYAPKLKNLQQAIGFYLDKHKTKRKDISVDLISIDLDRYGKKAKIKHYKNITG